MDAWSRQTFYYRKRIPDYRTEGVVGGDSNNMYIEAVSQTFLKNLTERSGVFYWLKGILQQHGTNFIQKKASLSRSFFENL